jgi:hypothetical protein
MHTSQPAAMPQPHTHKAPGQLLLPSHICHPHKISSQPWVRTCPDFTRQGSERQHGSRSVSATTQNTPTDQSIAAAPDTSQGPKRARGRSVNHAAQNPPNTTLTPQTLNSTTHQRYTHSQKTACMHTLGEAQGGLSAHGSKPKHSRHKQEQYLGQYCVRCIMRMAQRCKSAAKCGISSSSKVWPRDVHAVHAVCLVRITQPSTLLNQIV